MTSPVLKSITFPRTVAGSAAGCPNAGGSAKNNEADNSAVAATVPGHSKRMKKLLSMSLS
jgi:hypothetical protein